MQVRWSPEAAEDLERIGRLIQRVVHLWEEKSVPMVRVASGDLVYNVPLRMVGLD
jgi:plasmid stabilization system protein ParE